MGTDVIHSAAQLVRQLAGGCVKVFVESRVGRRRTVVRGTFILHVLDGIKKQCGIPIMDGGTNATSEVEVWLRPLPRKDQLAETVRELYEIQRLSINEIAKKLHCSPSNVSDLWRRSYEIRGLPSPKRLYNGPRKRSA